ncbi:hypothetical protein ElyMa_006223500 [Elysia marginata]|uniref:Secreted protein n=1 Tax=Elysia marginata TaxID=1093978 RepID=A0AAV4H710_9GAST|nr:hypothetical protein ElyMa_006223500 [Elysia marginata]
MMMMMMIMMMLMTMMMMMTTTMMVINDDDDDDDDADYDDDADNTIIIKAFKTNVNEYRFAKISKLQMAQNSAARLVCNKRKKDHVPIFWMRCTG